MVIAEVTGNNNTVEALIGLGTVSNIPTGQAIFEIQARRSTGPNISAIIYTMSILY